MSGPGKGAVANCRGSLGNLGECNRVPHLSGNQATLGWFSFGFNAIY
jgi:hypothetical protein